MPNVLDAGPILMGQVQRAQDSRTVVYRRGVDSVSLAATMGQSSFDQLDNGGVLQRVRSIDWLITAADLILASETVLPQDGDLIRDTVGSVVYVYEVAPFGGEGPWRYSGNEQTLRIHTKHVETEDA